MSKKKYFTHTIKDHEWKFYYQSNAAYIRAHGKDSGAITYPADGEVYFNSSSFTPSNVRHEIMHVYVESSSTVSSALTADQTEELCAQLYGDHGAEMDLLANKIMEFFLK